MSDENWKRHIEELIHRRMGDVFDRIDVFQDKLDAVHQAINDAITARKEQMTQQVTYEIGIAKDMQEVKEGLSVALKAIQALVLQEIGEQKELDKQILKAYTDGQLELVSDKAFCHGVALCLVKDLIRLIVEHLHLSHHRLPSVQIITAKEALENIEKLLGERNSDE